MKRNLIRTTAFVRAAKRVLRKKPAAVHEINETLHILETDAFHPLLRTHKLTGEMKGSWACSAGYDLRIIFSFVTHEAKEAVLLEAIGSHDEVY